MPWLAQGLSQPTWWARMAGRPVVAIGGVLEAQQVSDAAATGAAAVCLVRGLAARPVAAWQAAWERGRRAAGLSG
jgi:thiamine monophosphate synthase